jgi:hypothetical protein
MVLGSKPPWLISSGRVLVEELFHPTTDIFNDPFEAVVIGAFNMLLSLIRMKLYSPVRTLAGTYLFSHALAFPRWNGVLFSHLTFLADFSWSEAPFSLSV